MQLNTLALSALLTISNTGTSWGFAPSSVNAPRASGILNMQKDGSNDMIKQVQNGVFSAFVASTIFIGSTTLGNVEPAYAAQVKTAETTTITSKNTNAKAPVDPLAKEKSAVETAKSQLAAASAEVQKTGKALADANKAFAKASDVTTAAEKKVVASKKALIAANDKLADAKATENKTNDLGKMKEVESLAVKVGSAKDSLKASEKELSDAKAKQKAAGKVAGDADATATKALKVEKADKDNVANSVTKLGKAEKELAKTQKKDAEKKKKAEKEAKKAAQKKKEKEAKAKAKELKQKKKAEEQRKKVEAKRKADIAESLRKKEKDLKKLAAEKAAAEKAEKEALSKAKNLDSMIAKEKLEVEAVKKSQ